MGKESNSQLELFSDSGRSRQAPAVNGPFFTAMRGYEKKIFLIVAFIITAIISFSAGVERGKGSLQKREALIKSSPVSEGLPFTPPAVVAAGEKKFIEAVSALGNYTIQVATYKSERFARQEAEVLKQKGIAPIIMPKGEHYVLCAGRFESRQQAQQLFVKLNQEKRYSGVFIRRL